MKTSILWTCILVSLIGIAAVFYLFGATPSALLVAGLFLLCPVLVSLQILRGGRGFDADIAEARRHLQGRNLP
ncbi:MAG: hypothetical protein HYV16_02015 [Gammaproteobacteria bacterium]|nr:hypothetical protein [Gammaproteobacteria bacterium]